jgi:diguanylate cyclase (GGDEF)-like protein
MSQSRRQRIEVGAWVAGAALLLLALVVLALAQTSQRLLARSAEQAALKVAHRLVERVPELPQLFERQRVSAEVLHELSHLRGAGDVFGFRFFDRHGRPLLASSDLDQPDPLATLALAADAANPGAGHETVREIVEGGGTAALTRRGAGGPNRPEVYTEAFVPVLSDGTLIGVAEVHVDSTALAARIRAAFIEVALIVGLALALLGALWAAHGRRRHREQQRAESRAAYLSEHDVLSGALNRTSFHAALREAARARSPEGAAATVGAAGRAGQDPGLALLMIDIDDFNGVNDLLGTTGADAVLREATRRLHALVRQGDLLARMGGDVFAILQSGVGSLDDVQALAARIAQALAEPMEIDGQRIGNTVCIGAARLDVDAASADELLQKADAALARAKASGRARISLYDAALDRQLEDRRELLRELRSAAADGSLSMHYQALHDADGRTLLGYEALMRWKHPRRGMVPPSLFIPLAEESGLIEELGRWALERACAEAASWPAPLSVSVNLSAAQFRGASDLVAVVEGALAKAGLPAKRLVLEITESLLMTDTEGVMNTLARLSKLGVAIAMDDFGTGYSSLAYLWRFPFDKLKIDRAFTQGLAHDEKVLLIVRSIVSLAHSLGIRVNAEGVETESQMSALQNMGCDEMQGFLLSRPMPPETLTHAGAPTAAGAPARLRLPMATALG